MNREKLLRALRARGKSDGLAQMAADEIERIAAGVKTIGAAQVFDDGMIWRLEPDNCVPLLTGSPGGRLPRPPAKKAAAKKVKK